ncbi:MAG: lytic transglycosylase protein [Alphaproteobacteria bacterium]|nr:lytic transglycosylase protein [Alphaproteobacteria bacterium]
MNALKPLLLAATMLFAAAPLQAASEPAMGDLSTALPTQLTPAQRADYGAIFAAIRASDWIAASTRIALVGDGPLTAVANAELYLAKGSPKVELEPLMALLTQAADLPQAAQLSRLAATRGALELPPVAQAQRLIWGETQPRRARAKSIKGDMIASELEGLIQPLIKDNQPAAAEALLGEREAALTPDALTEYRQRIGWSYYIVGDDRSARRMADKARAGIGEWVLQAEWLAGLAAWRMHDYDAAAGNFATVAARATEVELSAAGHYWAARADMAGAHPERVQARLRTAARMNETFYGMLAQSALGIVAANPNAFHNYRDAEWRGVAGRPNVKAAIALVEIGERDLAEELIRYQAKISPSDHNGLLHLASVLNLPATQLWLAHNRPQGAQINMAARYPAPDWKPARGWRVDPSLVFAHTLQESGFRATVVSSAGATGLMQVRPGTASDIARSRGEILDPRQLTEPATNIEYGQSYLEFLRDDRGTGGLLPKVIAAYNCGPLPVAEWNLREMDGGDPLLYIESIPYWETRGYVPIILRNYWVYEQRAGRQQSNSRTALVQGLWPRFPGLPGATAVRMKSKSYAAAAQGTK